MLQIEKFCFLPNFKLLWGCWWGYLCVLVCVRVVYLYLIICHNATHVCGQLAPAGHAVHRILRSYIFDQCQSKLNNNVDKAVGSSSSSRRARSCSEACFLQTLLLRVYLPVNQTRSTAQGTPVSSVRMCLAFTSARTSGRPAVLLPLQIY